MLNEKYDIIIQIYFKYVILILLIKAISGLNTIISQANLSKFYIIKFTEIDQFDLDIHRMTQ